MILRCDGLKDCRTGEDENDCDAYFSNFEGDDSKFICDDGFEIDMIFHCDGLKDCDTGEDENDCYEGKSKCEKVSLIFLI